MRLFNALQRLFLLFCLYMIEYDLALLNRQEQGIRYSRDDFIARKHRLQMELLELETHQ